MKEKHMEQQKGFALIITILMILLLSLMGTFTFSRGMTEMLIAKNHQQETLVAYLAESGIQQVLAWFNHPEDFQGGGQFQNGFQGPPQTFFQRRFLKDNGTPSYFLHGKTPFQGTRENPDLLLSIPQDDHFLNHPSTGRFASLNNLGKIIQLKVYQPGHPWGLCTVESRAESKSGLQKTIIVELEPSPLTPIQAAIQTDSGSDGLGVPIRTHWGEVWVKGDGDLGKQLSLIPTLDPLATPSSASYGSGANKDPWVQFRIEDSIHSPTPLECTSCSQPYIKSGHDNIFQNQGLFSSDFSPDRWDYKKAKAFSKSIGRYYSTDLNGRLYRDGIEDSSHQSTPQTVFSSTEPGDHQGFVFIDTIDLRPPHSKNLATITIPMDYTEGLYYINAHITISTIGQGRPLTVFTPPFNQSLNGRKQMRLSRVNFNGVLYTTGSILAKESFKSYGSLVSQRGFIHPDQFEIWYNHNHLLGEFQNSPKVIISPGTWHELY